MGARGPDGPEAADSGTPGPSADVEGRTAIDPTENVRQLVNAMERRQDDLRIAEAKHHRDMRYQGDRTTREIIDLHAAYGQQLREAEAKRIDAIRAVDVAAVQRAAEVQATQATALQTQVATTAEAMRVQVATTAQAAAVALATALDPIQKRIEDLSRAQYETQGEKGQVRESRESGQSTGMWVGLGVSCFVAFVAVIGLVIAVIQAQP